MCGIVGAVANRDIVPILVDGLRRLEYRGYDSSGVAVIEASQAINRVRAVGKVAELESALRKGSAPTGGTGIAHTRWATHGRPSESNAHPHMCRQRVAVVCNGIIENHDQLRSEQISAGYEFSSETDTEVIVTEIHRHLEQGLELRPAVQRTVEALEGAFAIGVIATDQPDRLVGARRGSPLVIGLKDGEAFLASDMAALIAVTQRFIILEDGDIAEISCGNVSVYDDGRPVQRPIHISPLSADAVELGNYRHYMLKEIYEQGRAVADTLEGRLTTNRLLEAAFGPDSGPIFDATKFVQIIACGTSYYAGLVARIWFEAHGIPCDVEIASEFRYRAHVVPDDTLLVAISQSGETADTLAAVQEAKRLGYRYCAAICNVPESALVRGADLVLMTHAGPEIGVASTKAFTTQLTALLLLMIALGRRYGMSADTEAKIVAELRSLPVKIEQALRLDTEIAQIAEQFADKQHALFLGRGAHFPIALEGALKLKEISYIHAEAYPAGELKHGPLALVDANMPVVAVAPNNQLLEKLKSNIHEVRARGGKLIVFTEAAAGIDADSDLQVLPVAPVDDSISPIIYSIPLQLLAYHVAVIKGTDIDKPRNLAKSVTVE
ncbi:MAG: glutamine--fructose-6-phosphate transaminase (isomerizing) [Gammaproteobacteria bacterium]|nr:glutamine--fructose-6-phosphate transaminase (isomerizing) [Gammaproteobacteria bacterium]MDH3464872.1 glutamine--fructose-6-phosphate transaminase (isomerizing) [Gammaproteobacteria bacterium]